MALPGLGLLEWPYQVGSFEVGGDGATHGATHGTGGGAHSTSSARGTSWTSYAALGLFGGFRARTMTWTGASSATCGSGSATSAQLFDVRPPEEGARLRSAIMTAGPEALGASGGLAPCGTL